MVCWEYQGKTAGNAQDHVLLLLPGEPLDVLPGQEYEAELT
jgi:hypothetical protein